MGWDWGRSRGWGRGRANRCQALSATVTTFCLDAATPTTRAAHVGTLTHAQTHTEGERCQQKTEKATECNYENSFDLCL